MMNEYPEHIFTMDGKEFMDYGKAHSALMEHIHDERSYGNRVSHLEWNIHENHLFTGYVLVGEFDDNSYAVYCHNKNIVLVDKTMIDNGEAFIIGMNDLSDKDHITAKTLIEKFA